MKKIISICLVLFLILPCLALFCACGEKSIKELEIVGKLETTLYLNEEPDLSKIKIKYSYDDGRQVDISLNKEMISNLSTVNPGTKTMTISYLDKSVDLQYTVLNLKYQNFVSSKKVNGKEDVALEVEENYVFNRDGSLNVTIGEDVYRGTYTISEDGNLQLSYKKTGQQEVIIVNYIKVSYGKYKSESLIDGFYKILDAVLV